jgi:energy-coupling factor transporter ATP-binding protein EcfA2
MSNAGQAFPPRVAYRLQKLQQPPPVGLTFLPTLPVAFDDATRDVNRATTPTNSPTPPTTTPFDAATVLAALPAFQAASVMRPGVGAVVTGPSCSGKTTLATALLGCMSAQLTGGTYAPQTAMDAPTVDRIVDEIPLTEPTGYLAEVTADLLDTEDASTVQATMDAACAALAGTVTHLTLVLTTDMHYIVPRAAMGLSNVVRFLLPGSPTWDLQNAWNQAFSMFYTFDNFCSLVAALPQYTALAMWIDPTSGGQLATYQVAMAGTGTCTGTGTGDDSGTGTGDDSGTGTGTGTGAGDDSGTGAGDDSGTGTGDDSGTGTGDSGTGTGDSGTGTGDSGTGTGDSGTGTGDSGTGTGDSGTGTGDDSGTGAGDDSGTGSS